MVGKPSDSGGTVLIDEAFLASYSLAEGQERARVFDSRTPGFGVVIGKRRISFVAQRRIKGESSQRTVTLGHWAPSRLRAADASLRSRTLSVAQARAAADAALVDMRRGEDPRGADAPGRSAGGPTLRDALEFHVGKMTRGENRRGKVCSPRSVATTRGSVEKHLADWLDRPLVELDADAIEAVMRRIERETPRKAGSNPDNPPGRAEANRVIANVSKVWRSWHRRHGLAVTCPTDRLMQAALKPRDSRIPDDGFADWYARVMGMTNGVRRDLQLVGLFSGVRTDGVRTLRWEDVDLEDELIHISRAKGDRPYTLPMTATLREILERRRRENADPMCCPEVAELGGDAGYVFPSVTRDGERVQAVAEPKERRVVRDAKGRPVRDDDGNTIRETYLPGVQASRKTYNSVAIEIGIPLEAREAFLNHAGRGVNVRSYGFPENWDHLRTCADRIEAALWERIRGGDRRTSRRGSRRARAA